MTNRAYAFAALVSLAIAMLASGCGDPSDSSDASPSTTASAIASATGIATATPSSAADAPTETPIASATRLPTRSVPTLAPSPASAPAPATLDFSSMPADPWYHASESGTATVDAGILTIDAPSGANEFSMSIDGGGPHPADPWTANVSNSRGWWVEVRMRVDPLTDDMCVSDNTRGPALTLWTTDDTAMLVRLGFSRSCVALILSYDTAIKVPIDATSAFHVYRVSTIGRHVRVSVDGTTVIDHQYPEQFDEAITGLHFGDGQSGPGPTRSYWDYITYDTSGPGP